MTPTVYYHDLLAYYKRAEYLEQRNLARLQASVNSQPFTEWAPCGDPLQDHVPIYDTVHRRYAGFSKVLEDIHGRRPDRYRPASVSSSWGSATWRYLELVHRATGSGASFEKDHGYRNTCIPTLAKLPSLAEMAGQLEAWDGDPDRPALFTSLGNQIPPFPKPAAGFTSGGLMYLSRYAPKLARDYVAWLHREVDSGLVPQRRAVDWACAWHREHGLKQFHFVLTAWVMDTAEYAPHLVDPRSICNYGKNAKETLDLCFERPAKMRADAFYDEATRLICEATGALPYDLEDCLCDYIRYVENFIPAHGFDHLDRNKIWNSSLVTNHPKGRQRRDHYIVQVW